MHADPNVRPGLARLVALAFAAAFVVIGSVNLGAQGAQHDELHQATASFAWCGRDVELFAHAKVFGLPLFNMTYSGAIKSNLYGCWMWLSGTPFTLQSWRWLGLLSGAAGIVAFGLLVARTWAPWRLALLLGFVVTDVTLVVCCRHDWGPVALAFLLRMTMLGLCLRRPRADERAAPLVLGLLLGLSVYEKLSSVVTVVPVLLLYFAPEVRRTRGAAARIAAGAVVGAAPVVLWNLRWLLEAGQIASLYQSGVPATHGLDDLAGLLRDSVVMPQGDRVQRFVFGTRAAPWTELLEAALLLAGLALALASGRRRAAVAVAGALCIVAGLFALPSRIGIHHIVLLTPWPYLAVTLAVGAGPRGRVLGALVTAWLLLRAVTSAGLVTVLLAGRAGPEWSPDLHRLASFAARSEPRDLFVAGDWGVATQISCAVQGREGAVVESFWTGRLPDLAGAERVFLIGLEPPGEVPPTAFDTLAVQLEATGAWRPDELPPALAGLRDLRALAYRRRR